MENPLLTFASPTLIVGDKSQVSVAIHEIGHSWFGNELGFARWEDLWIAEGFTVFVERKVPTTAPPAGGGGGGSGHFRVMSHPALAARHALRLPLGSHPARGGRHGGGEGRRDRREPVAA